MIGELIAKETIDVSRIISSGVELSADASARLRTAGRLGNEFKAKATITFNTIDGPKKVETTVWSVTEKYIQLKNGIHLPLKSIIDIDF